MSGSLTFDVLVLSGKAQWTSISRWPDANAAQSEARKLVASKKYLGVKVSQESFDHFENRFSEKTLFKHLKNDNAATMRATTAAATSGSARADYDASDDFDEFDDFDDYDDGIDWVLPVFGLFTVLAVVLVLGIFFFDGNTERGQNAGSGSSSSSDYFVFDLPPVTATISGGNENVSVRVDLKLELNDAGDAKAVELRLAKIMETVIARIQETDARDLKRIEKIQILRSELREGIQDAMGETNLNGVLFHSIHIF